VPQSGRGEQFLPEHGAFRGVRGTVLLLAAFTGRTPLLRIPFRAQYSAHSDSGSPHPNAGTGADRNLPVAKGKKMARSAGGTAAGYACRGTAPASTGGSSSRVEISGDPMRLRHVPGVADHSPRPEEAFVEVVLLLPGWQVAALETAAESRGLTTGRLLRRVIRGFLTGVNDPLPPRLPTPLDAEGKPSESRLRRGGEPPQAARKGSEMPP
jgi:hypothetical protein